MKNVLLGLLLLVYNSTFSQSNFLINKFDVENISAENVNSIFLDKNNFFWVSTPEGLNRYDGSINSIFKSNPFDSTTLSNNLVYETFQIDNNGLYIKSKKSGDISNNLINESCFNSKRKKIVFMKKGTMKQIIIKTMIF